MTAYNPSGPIRMVDNLKYITVTNTSSDVTVFVSKDQLVIQRESASTFFIKNDTYVCYYNYTDVSIPVSKGIDHLLEILIYFVNNYVPEICTNGYVPLVTHAVSCSFQTPSSDIISSGTSNIPIFSLKVPASSSTTAQLRKLSVLNLTSETVAEWKLVLNATLTGPTFKSISGSQLEASITETSMNNVNSITVASGYIYNLSATNHDLSYVPLGMSNVLTFAASSIKGSPELMCSIDWSEDAPLELPG